MDAIGFSPDSRKLTVNSEGGRCLEVWGAQTQKLSGGVGIQKVPLPGSSSVKFPPTATLVFGTMIVAAFTFKVSQVITTP